jgi:hypothetical protein
MSFTFRNVESVPGWFRRRIGAFEHRDGIVRPDEKAKIAQYLENPVSNGLWHLNADWIQRDGLSWDIWNEVKKEIEGRDVLIVRSGKRERRIQVDDDWKENMAVEVCSTLTFPFALFSYLARQESQQPEVVEQAITDDNDALFVLVIIDIAPIKQKYEDAFLFFKSHIFHHDFVPVAKANQPIRFSRGTIILQKGPRSDNNLSAISWDSMPLSDLKTFLEKIGKIASPTLMPVFSPEEEVFEPYFDLLEMVDDVVIPQRHLLPYVRKAIINFRENNFSDSVSALGLASEDVLTQIFETLYREQLTKGLTLGQLADELSARAAAKFRKKDDPAPDPSVLYPELKAAIEDPNLTAAKAVELVRRVLTSSLEASKYTNDRINRIGKPDRKVLIWPELVNNAVVELIRCRNAASHKSRIPIGPMDCRRAAFSFVVLVRWWFKERTQINWSMSPDEILKDRVDKYSKA